MCLSKTCCGHFANGTFIIYHSKKPKTIETIINTELKEVVKWLRLNKLSLNTAKTELIFFHSAKHPLNYGSISIKMNGFKLTPVDFIKYQGMYLQPRPLGPTDIVNWPWSSPLTHREMGDTLAIHIKRRHSETLKNTTKETHRETHRNTQIVQLVLFFVETKKNCDLQYFLL